jgi:deoxyribodipyrimidine photolyase-related protein
LECKQPDESRLDVQLSRLASSLSIASAVVDTEHYLTSRNQVTQHFQGKKRFLMETFYRQMRRRYDIFMDNLGALGRKWAAGIQRS